MVEILRQDPGGEEELTRPNVGGGGPVDEESDVLEASGTVGMAAMASAPIPEVGFGRRGGCPRCRRCDRNWSRKPYVHGASTGNGGTGNGGGEADSGKQRDFLFQSTLHFRSDVPWHMAT
jgi:hypothetical protein